MHTEELRLNILIKAKDCSQNQVRKLLDGIHTPRQDFSCKVKEKVVPVLN
jgi:hypothetical protein